MRWKQFFTPIQSSFSADQAKEFLTHTSGDRVILLDVRQPEEYAAGHIPGARLISLGDLFKRMGEIEPDKPVLVYCAIGGRSRVAAQMLAEEGFREIYDLAGGIKAWNSKKAFGTEDTGLHLFSGNESPAETLVVAYGLEAGLRDFYLSMAPRIKNKPARHMFEQLAVIEKKHQNQIFDAYLKITKSEISRPDFEQRIVTTAMEGGLTTEEYVNLYQPDMENTVEVISLAMAIEAQALDLYHRAALQAENPETRTALMDIADDERSHLDRLGKLFEDL